jgi:hypothetical protein
MKLGEGGIPRIDIKRVFMKPFGYNHLSWETKKVMEDKFRHSFGTELEINLIED